MGETGYHKWPKQYEKLSKEQLAIRDDWTHYWHDVLPSHFGIIDKFNHGWPAKQWLNKIKIRKNMGGGRYSVLEIGAGMGEHISYENLNYLDYSVLELRDIMAQEIRKRFPNVKVCVGDCQEQIDVEDNSFDRAIAIHVLEHLPNLPKAIEQMHRILKKDGVFQVVIPCEGCLAYAIARKISTERIFKKRYHMSYDWCIKSEHINYPDEVIQELEKFFVIKKKKFFPFTIPLKSCNLVIALELLPK